MDLPSSKLESINEEEWQLIDTDWWHTPYLSVSWKYIHDENPTTTLITNSPSYHATIQRTLFSFPDSFSSQKRPDYDLCEDELALNPNLCGVQSAIDVLIPYETLEGILAVDEKNEPIPRRRDIATTVQEDDLALTKELWEKAAEDLFTLPKPPITDDGLSGGSSLSSSPSDLYRSLSTYSSADLTDSDLSFNSASRPATPQHRVTDTIAQVRDASPSKGTPSGRPLNASASSFIPSSLIPKLDISQDTFSPHPAFPDLLFPCSAVPPASSVKLRKDDQGFYSREEVELTSQPVSLPIFLQKPPPRRRAQASRTRAIIDRIRSAQGSFGEPLRNSQSHCPSPNPLSSDQNSSEERGSISDSGKGLSGKSSPSSGLDEDVAEWRNVNPGTRAGRTRNLFLAFTRRRSGPSSPTQVSNGVNHKEIEIPITSSPVPLTPPVAQTSNGERKGVVLVSSKADIKPASNSQRQGNSRTRSNKRRRSPQAVVQPMVPASLVAPPASSAPILQQPNAPLFAAAANGPLTPTFPGHPPPASYVYGTYSTVLPPMAYTSYLQQLQLQLQQQLQMRTATVSDRSQRNREAVVVPPPYTGEYFHIPKKSFTAPAMSITPFMHTNAPVTLLRHDAVW